MWIWSVGNDFVPEQIWIWIIFIILVYYEYEYKYYSWFSSPSPRIKIWILFLRNIHEYIWMFEYWLHSGWNPNFSQIPQTLDIITFSQIHQFFTICSRNPQQVSKELFGKYLSGKVLKPWLACHIQQLQVFWWEKRARQWLFHGRMKLDIWVTMTSMVIKHYLRSHFSTTCAHVRSKPKASLAMRWWVE